MEHYTVFCVLASSTTPIIVDIGKDLTVGHLKKEIWKEEAPTFNDFLPRQLTLFKINAYGANDEERTKALEEELRRIPSNSDTPLDAFERIFNVFPGTPEKTYHILVVVPQGEHSTHGRGHW